MQAALVLQQSVSRIQRRIRLALALRGAMVGLTVGLGADLAFLALARFHVWKDAPDYLLTSAIAATLIGAVIGYTRRVTALDAAMIADERAGLKERLSTAVEILASAKPDSMAEAQIGDAAQHAAKLSPSRLIPWRLPETWKWPAALAVLVAAALIVPNLPVFQSRQQQADAAAMKSEGKKIQAIAKQVEQESEKRKQQGEEDRLLKQLAKNMRDLGKDMSRNRVPKKQALLEFNKLQEQLKDATERTGNGEGKRPLDQVSNDLQSRAQKMEQQGSTQAARALRQMAEKLSKRDFEAMKQQLQELARQMKAGEVNPQNSQQLAEAMEQMSQAMQSSSLQQAGSEMKEASDQLKKAADLAKQLQKQVQSMTPEQRKELEQQVAQAMSSAGEKTHQAGGT